MAADVLPSGAKFAATQLPMETVKQLLKRHSTASPKTKLLLENECEVILECRFCQSMFRRSVDFISHKENYCKSAQSAMANLTSIKPAAESTEEADLSQQVMHATPKNNNKIVSVEENGTQVEERRPVVKFKNQIPPDRQPAVIPAQQNVLYRRETRSASKRSMPATFVEPEPKKKASSVLTVGSTRFLPARLQEKATPKPEAKEPEKAPVKEEQPTVSPSPVRLKKYDEDNYEFDPDHTPTENEEQMYSRVFKFIRNSVDLEALRCVEPECEDFSNFQSIESLAFHLIVRHTRKCVWFQYYACLLCNRKLRSLKSILEHVAKRHMNIYQNHMRTCDPSVTFPSMEFPEGEVEGFKLPPLCLVAHAHGDQETAEPDKPAKPEEQEDKKDDDWAAQMKENFKNLAHALQNVLKEQDFSVGEFHFSSDDMPPLTKEEPIDEFSGGEEESPPVLSAEDQDDSAGIIEEEVGAEAHAEPKLDESDVSVDVLNVSGESAKAKPNEEVEEMTVKEAEAGQDEEPASNEESNCPELEMLETKPSEPAQPESELEQNADSNGPPPLSPHMSTYVYEGLPRDELIVEHMMRTSVAPPLGFEKAVDDEIAMHYQKFLHEEEPKNEDEESIEPEPEPVASPNEKSAPSSLDVTTESNSSTASTSSSGKRERRLPNRYREDTFQLSSVGRERERPSKERSVKKEGASVTPRYIPEAPPVLEREEHPVLESEMPPVIEKMVSSPERARSLSSGDNSRGTRMFNTSTQRKRWMFESQEAIDRKREDTQTAYREKSAQLMPSGSADDPYFLNLNDEKMFLKIVTCTSLLFGDEFKPPMWPSVKWMAQAYFKRFFLRHSAMEYSPKNIVMACYYVAAKVEEFNVSIDEFLRNFRTGTFESNMDTVLSLEPVVMMAMDYDLIIHTPYRAFEGHLLEMKATLVLAGGFDLEEVRPFANQFFAKSVIGDAMFLYPPSQIALAGLKYGLERQLKKQPELLKEFLYALLGKEQNYGGDDDPTVVQMLEKLEEVINYVDASSADLTEQDKNYVKLKFATLVKTQQANARPLPTAQESDNSDED